MIIDAEDNIKRLVREVRRPRRGYGSRGIFKRNLLSLMLLVIAIVPLSSILPEYV